MGFAKKKAMAEHKEMVNKCYYKKKEGYWWLKESNTLHNMHNLSNSKCFCETTYKFHEYYSDIKNLHPTYFKVFLIYIPQNQYCGQKR